MYDIKLFGIGSSKYRLLSNNILTAIRDLRIDAQIEQIQEIEAFIKYNIQVIPTLMIDNKIKIIGRSADVSELKRLLKQVKTKSQFKKS